MSRLKKFLAIIFNPKFFGALSFIYGILSFIRDEFLPLDLAERFRLGGLLITINWYWWVITGIVIWAISIAWESSKHRNEDKTNALETHFKRDDIEVESTNQSGGITGNINARDVYEGGIHFHGIEFANEKVEKLPLSDTGINQQEILVGEKYYQIKSTDKSLKNIAKKEYGSVKFAKHLEEGNRGIKSLPPKGSYIVLPPAIILTPTSRENGQYASLRVQSKQTEKSVFCTPILSKVLWWDEEKDQWIDKTEKLGDDERFLSWHHGSNSPEKEIKPDIGGIINITEFTGVMNFTIYHPKEPLWAGSYKVWIIVKWRRNSNDFNYNTERIIVCIDTIPSNKKPKYPYELDVKECKNQKW